MDSTPRKAGTAFEYFLYTAIVAETGLAALIYKTLFGSADLERMRIYFAIFYFGFLGWAIFQLNKVHRHRKMAAPEPTASDTPPAPGLTGGQIMIIAVVFASAVAAFTWLLRLTL
jgi:hypothetical protein